MKINGYTLIELLVVMGIFALLFSFSFAAYTTFNKNRSLENGAREVEAVLRDAQHRAITGEYDQTGGTCTKLISWRVVWTANSADYTLFGSCQTSGGPLDFKTAPFELSSVGTVQFSNGNVVTFNPFIQSPTITQPVCIHFSGDTTNYYKVTVTAGGAIDVTKTGPPCP